MSLEATVPRPPEGPERAGDGLASTIGRLVHLCQASLPPGEVAELRRLKLDNPWVPAFWRIAAQVLEPAGHLAGPPPAREEAERRWGTILAIVADLAAFHSHERSLGRALAHAEFSDLRFMRLVRASGEGLLVESRQAARFLASKGEAARLTDFAYLLLSDGSPRSEDVRRRMARDFYSGATSAPSERTR